MVKYFHTSEAAEPSSPEVVGGASAGTVYPEPARPAARSRGTADAKLVLSVYGMNYTAIDTALDRVEQLCKDAEKTNVVHHSAVSKLTSDQVTQLEKIRQCPIIGSLLEKSPPADNLRVKICPARLGETDFYR